MLTKRTLFIGIVTATFLSTPAYALFGGDKEYLSQAEVKKLVIGKSIRTSFGTWKWNESSFTFQYASGKNRGKVFGPHQWSWSGDAIRSPRNRYRFYVKKGGNVIYINQQNGGDHKTQLKR